MIYRKTTTLPIICFDDRHDWPDLLSLASPHLDLDGLNRLRGALGGTAMSVAVERHYIDKDYRDTFSGYHSKRFFTPDARCIRLHFFRSAVTPKQLRRAHKIQPTYLGYSVIRPTRPYSIGRTLLEPATLSDHPVYLSMCEEDVHLQGVRLTARGFPFISQDGDATVCAQSVVWMLVRYFSNKYRSYPEMTPFRLTSLVENYAVGRIYPSAGLYVWQLAEMLRRLRFAPVIYSRMEHDNTALQRKDFDRWLYTYLESGIPVIAGLPGHVVVLFGHVSEYARLKNTPPNQIAYSSDACRGFLGHDDGGLPYELLCSDDSSTMRSGKLKLSELTEFVPALPEKVFLPAEAFHVLVLKLLHHPQFGLAHLSRTFLGEPPLLRMFLTTGSSLKAKLSERGMGDELVAQVYRELPLPHFIWVCEIASRDTYPHSCCGEIIWDATRNPYEEDGWIALHYPEILIVDVGTTLNDLPRHVEFTKLIGSGYPVHKSNLVAL